MMALKFDKISGNDAIFKNPEYIADSIIFNAIESARNDESYELYSDHKNVIISTSKKGSRVWIWTSSAIRNDTSKLIDICRFLRDCNIPKVEIYVKQDVSGNLSDLYALASLDLDYVVKDEFSLAVFTQKSRDKSDIELGEGEEIIHVDKNNPEHKKLITEFYGQCKDEFRWHGEKFDRKVEEYLNMELYALVKNKKAVSVAVIGSTTEDYIRIKSIAVLKPERRKGFGTKICTFVSNAIKDKGHTPMLYSHVGNKSAMALWSKTGFKLNDKLYLLKIEDNA